MLNAINENRISCIILKLWIFSPYFNSTSVQFSLVQFSCSVVSNSLRPMNCSTPGLPVGEGNGTPLQYSCLENPMMEEPGRLQSMGSLRVGHDWGTSLSLVHFHALEKEMATHSSVLAWRIPGAGEPGGLTSMGSHRVGHDWSDLAAAATDLPVYHQLLEFTQTHVHRVGDAIQPSHPLWSPSPPAPNPSQHQALFQWVNSSHEVAKVLEFQL